MAKIAELTDPAVWEEWVSTRPLVVQELCRRYPPDRLYLLKPQGQRVTILAYAENGTLRVNVSGEWNCLVFERDVFGINPNDLEECDLPNENEVTGTMLTKEDDVKAFCAMLRDDMGANAEEATQPGRLKHRMGNK